MLRVIGSLPAVKLPKLTITGVTETRARTIPETGISTLGCCETPVATRTGAFKSPSGASVVTVMCSLYCSPGRPGILSLSPAGVMSALTYGWADSEIVGLKPFSSDTMITSRASLSPLTTDIRT